MPFLYLSLSLGLLLVKESLVTLVDPVTLSLAKHLSYHSNTQHLHESLYPRSRCGTPTLTEEPKRIGSMAQLMECASVGRNVHQTQSIVTSNLSSLPSENIRVSVIMTECPMNYTESIT